MSKLNKDSIKQIITLYQDGANTTQIAKQFNVTPTWICILLKRNGIKTKSPSGRHRKYFLNESYFSEMNSNEKAQLLGMIAADGNVAKNRNHFEITLQIGDRYYLEYMAKCLEYTGPLYKVHNKRFNTDYARLSITSKNLKEDLGALGIVPKKSLILECPTESQVPASIIHSYILGFFEGDGSITVSSKRKYDVRACIKLSVNLVLGQKMKELIEKHVGVNCYLYPVKKYKKKHTQVYNLVIGGVQQVLDMCEWMYKDAPFRLQRKYDKYRYLRSFFDENRERIRDVNWKEIFKSKIKETHTKNGTRAGRKSKFDVYFLSPSKEVFRVSLIKPFAKEMGLTDASLYKLAGGKRTEPYKNWTIATPDQIAAARLSNSLIIKDYSLPLKTP